MHEITLKEDDLYASPIIPWEVPLCPWTADGKWPDDTRIIIEVVCDRDGIRTNFVPAKYKPAT